MAAISNQQSVASSEFKQVWNVAIPDPDCKKPLSECPTTIIPIDDSALQTELYKWDSNHDNLLSVADIAGDPSAAIPALATNRLAQLLVGSQYLIGSKDNFKTIDDFLNVVRTTQSIDQAYETVQWLNSLPSKHINGDEIEFNAADWKQIVTRLGNRGNGYVTQVNQAGRLFQSTISLVPGVKSLDFLLQACDKDGGCSTIGYSFYIDPTAASFGLRNLATNWSQKMAAVYDFALNSEIECEGSGCPDQDESYRPYYDHDAGINIKRGLSIALRNGPDVDGKQSYAAFRNHFGWSSGNENLIQSMEEYLQQQTLATIAVK